MKTVILAGGFGTRISEESMVRPKPMVEIGDKPILWHILKIYYAQGFDDFIICCGYKGQMIKEFFANYKLLNSDFSIDFKDGKTTILKNGAEKWKVTLVDTGSESMTGGRLRRVKEYIGNETFMVTYGDGLSNVNLKELVAFHKENKGLVTVTAVPSPGRFGAFTLHADSSKVANFREKPSGDGIDEAWISGGYFVMEPGIFDYIEDDKTVWEETPMRTIAHEGKLVARRHDGFWHPIDTLRDKMVIEKMWQTGTAPWKLW